MAPKTVIRPIFKWGNSLYLGFSRTELLGVVGTLELYHVSPMPLINVGKYRVSFSNKKGKNYLIIDIESKGAGL